ncbi:hypothetical protein AHAS_Ahas06G0002400 [Arachis hypogaea]
MHDPRKESCSYSSEMLPHGFCFCLLSSSAFLLTSGKEKKNKLEKCIINGFGSLSSYAYSLRCVYKIVLLN